MNAKWIIDQNVNPRTHKTCLENKEENLWDPGLGLKLFIS